MLAGPHDTGHDAPCITALLGIPGVEGVQAFLPAVMRLRNDIKSVTPELRQRCNNTAPGKPEAYSTTGTEVMQPCCIKSSREHKTSRSFTTNRKEILMENENENRDHNPLKDNQDDSWIVAALTTAFVAGVGATIAAIKLVSKLVNK